MASLLLGGCAARTSSDVKSLLEKQQKDIQKFTEQERKLDARLAELEKSVQPGQVVSLTPLPQSGGSLSMVQGIPGGEYDTIFSNEVYFNLGDYHLSRNDQQILDLAAKAMAQSSTALLEITGHTDASGQAFFNQLLSDQRANSALRYLRQKFDIPLHRMFSLGFGSEIQKYSDDTGTERNKNRRIEIRVLVMRAARGNF
jgi:outer membrane protein OmpA-like peptidoglycan-associated protein